ncbi:hypothetical protein M1O53_03380 [Dehalococcoidia bacterium]|nr:hypothetical protein [Dehalococcoidia bacterium]
MRLLKFEIEDVETLVKDLEGVGGGKADIGQAGGKDKSKIDEALRLVPELVRKG